MANTNNGRFVWYEHLNGPTDIPGGARIAQLLDPQGAAFSLHQAPPA